MRGLGKSPVLTNAIALYAVQAANYIIPLVTIPYLTRTLTPVGWGEVAFTQSLGLSLISVCDYGFSLSVSRDIAIRRDEPAFLGKALGSVTCAKLFILAITLSLAFVGSIFVPFFRSHRVMLCAGLLWASAQGMSPLWFYQGLEKMRVPSTVDVCVKGTAVLLIYLLVSAPTHGFRVLMIYAAASTLSTLILYAMVLPRYGFVLPSIADVGSTLRQGLAMFTLQASVSLYTNANAFVLGLLASPYQVGIYASAERFARSLLNLLTPINQALYPQMNLVIHTDRDRGRALVRRAFYLTLVATVALALCAGFAAPSVVALLLGKDFHASIGVLRVLLLLLPVIGASNMLGLQWMLPLRLDKAFSTIIVAAGVGNLVLASFLARRFQAYGMAVSVVCAESVVVIGCFLFLAARGLNPLTTTPALPQDYLHQEARS